MKTRTIAIIAILALFCGASAYAQKNPGREEVAAALQGYFTPVLSPGARPDARGFIRRWMLLDPISKPNRTNRVFTDSYTREAILHEYFPGQLTKIPKDGERERVLMEVQPPVNLSAGRPAAETPAPEFKQTNLYWHALDSDMFYVKLFRLAANLDNTRYGVIFWAVTIVNCDRDIQNVRLAIGANNAAMFWVNGEELLLVSGDRHMNIDNALSKRITLKKGKNVVRAAVINGPGMSEFCARFVDEDGKPVTGYTVTLN